MKNRLRKIFWKIFKIRIFQVKGNFVTDEKLKEHILDNVEFGKQTELKIKKGD